MMDYVPPQVIEYALTEAEQKLNAVINIPGVTFKRGRDEFGVDYQVKKNVTVGARYGSKAHIINGPVYDSRYSVKITVRF